MSMAERIDQMTVVDPNTGFRMGINSKGSLLRHAAERFNRHEDDDQHL